jgi:AcrR family transcriptional regulator
MGMRTAQRRLPRRRLVRPPAREQNGRVTAERAQPSVGPWERKRIRMSLEIERIALELMSQYGVANVTVEQVAAAAGISTRTFFRYFRNVRHVLTGVPTRHTELLCARVSARPADEGILDAFRAAFEQDDSILLGVADRDLKEETLKLWGEIVRRERETVTVTSAVVEIMATAFEDLITQRLHVGARDDMTAGVLASALAGVIWFVYVRWLQGGSTGSLHARFNDALAVLADLGSQPDERPARRPARKRAPAR